MRPYQQPIILFGIMLPVIVGSVLVGICYMLQSNMEASFADKQNGFKEAEASRRAGVAIEAQIGSQRQDIARWEKLLSQETASAVTTNLREVAKDLPSKEYQQTSFECPGSKGTFGTNTAQNSSLIRIAFRGSYRTMQRAFLDLETRMPQLQLQELKIDPSAGISSLLKFEVTYTAWEK
jgi:hypothetical protein